MRARPRPGPHVDDRRTRRGTGQAPSRPLTQNATAQTHPTSRPRKSVARSTPRAAMERDPKGALALAQEASDLRRRCSCPAAAICGRLAAQAGDYRRASRILEAAYAQTPRPRRRLSARSPRQFIGRAASRARAPRPIPEKITLTVGRAALEAHDGAAAARAADRPAHRLGTATQPPRRGACLLMADIEEAEQETEARCASGSLAPPRPA